MCFRKQLSTHRVPHGILKLQLVCPVGLCVWVCRSLDITESSRSLLRVIRWGSIPTFNHLEDPPLPNHLSLMDTLPFSIPLNLRQPTMCVYAETQAAHTYMPTHNVRVCENVPYHLFSSLLM